MAIKTDTIITRYEVVTVNHEQGVDRIKQKQQQLNATLKDWNEEAKRVESIHTAAWKKAGLALAGFGAVVVAGRAAFQAYAKEMKFSAAAVGVDIERLSKASGGLQSRMELLEFAAKAQSTAFKLSTEQMEIAQKAILAITRAGYDHEEATKKVTEAIVKLEGDGLKDFGIRVREAKTDTEKFTAIMDALSGSAKAVDGTVASQTESVQALGVRFEDAFQRIKVSLGEVVVSMTPLIEAVAKLTEGAAGLFGTITDGWSQIGQIFSQDDQFLARHGLTRDKQSGQIYRSNARDIFIANGGSGEEFDKQQRLNAASKRLEPAARAILEGLYGEAAAAFERLTTTEMDPMFVGKRKGGGPDTREAMRKAAAALSDRVQRDLTDALVDELEADARDRFSATGGFSDFAAQPDLTAELARFYGAGGEQARREAGGYADFNAARSQSRLEAVFGPVEDFNAYAQAFQVLQGAVGSAMGAWIDGSKSAGEAFQDFIAQALGGIATQMLAESIKHAAFAIGSFWNPAAAAMHAKSAAAFAAGAVVVGGMAKAMHHGGSGSSSTSPAAAAPTYSGGGGAPSGGGSNVTIVYGPEYTNQSARMRQLHAQKLYEQAKGTPGVTYA